MLPQQAQVIVRQLLRAEQTGADAWVQLMHRVDGAVVERLQDEAVLQPLFSHRGLDELGEGDGIEVATLRSGQRVSPDEAQQRAFSAVRQQSRDRRYRNAII